MLAAVGVETWSVVEKGYSAGEGAILTDRGVGGERNCGKREEKRGEGVGKSDVLEWGEREGRKRGRGKEVRVGDGGGGEGRKRVKGGGRSKSVH